MPGLLKPQLHSPVCTAQPQPQNQHSAPCRRRLLASVASLAVLATQSAPAQANFATDAASSAKAKLTAGEKAFVDSELLKGLREKTDLNKAKNKREIVDKYCYRQAELGVGDCAGLRLIPGATKSGRQKPPEWLKALPFYPKEAPVEKKASSAESGE